MKEYDLILIGTGSALEIAYAMIQENPNVRVAVIDKDEPGGICLTRGCIPSKLLIHSADLVRLIENTAQFGIHVEIRKIDFKAAMERMRSIIYKEIDMIHQGLAHSKNIDYYPTVAEFTAPYTLLVGNETIRSKMIFLCTGSRPTIPNVDRLEETGYLTSDTILKMDKLPESIAIVGAGYIAAEYGHFLSAMGSKVTIIGRGPQFLPQEEPEISALAKREMQKHATIFVNHEVRKVEKTTNGKKRLIAVNLKTGKDTGIFADEILVAAGRSPNTDILHPERAGIMTDKNGFIATNEYLETTQPNVWVVGDADGRYMFKHVANYESLVVYQNAVLKKPTKVDYHAVPHAVFTNPEIASVGLKEKEAVERYGKENTLIGIWRYEDTAKGEAMSLKDVFAKVIVERQTSRILGAHIIGPHASVLLQEIANLMYTLDQSAKPLISAMHIHPALSEVVRRAFGELMPPDQYHHVITEHFRLPTT